MKKMAYFGRQTHFPLSDTLTIASGTTTAQIVKERLLIADHYADSYFIITTEWE